MDVSGLLFELATSDRLAILSNIDKKPMKLTQVNKTLDSTVQATSRQLQRLHEADLIKKNSLGQYQITQFGKLALALLPSFNFINNHKDFLQNHDLTFLPEKFIQRIGQLSENKHLDGTDLSLSFRGENILLDAKEYICCMSDEMGYSFSHRSFTERQNSEKIVWKYIFPKSLSKNLIEDTLTRGTAIAPLANFKTAFLENPKISICMNEKNAYIAFPDLNGRIDYRSVFVGGGPSFHQWCFDYFNCCWKKAKKNLQFNHKPKN